MCSDCKLRPPVAYSWLLRLASLIVRRNARDAWLSRRETSLASLWILCERGELPGDSDACLAWLCRDAWANAFLVRCDGFDPRRWIRAPGFLMAASATAALLLAVATHGFAVSRSLLEALGDTASGVNQNRLMANLFPVAFALAAALLVAVGRISLRRHSGRYLSFLLIKTIALVTVMPLLWIEGGAALRGCIPNQTLRVLAGGLVLAVMFVGAVCWSVLWSLADQQHRCPVCLRRLVMPVRMGSWADVFEPVTTEWVCEEGHGAFCEHEVENGAPDRWIELEPLQRSVVTMREPGRRES